MRPDSFPESSKSKTVLPFKVYLFFVIGAIELTACLPFYKVLGPKGDTFPTIVGFPNTFYFGINEGKIVFTCEVSGKKFGFAI